MVVWFVMMMRRSGCVIRRIFPINQPDRISGWTQIQAANYPMTYAFLYYTVDNRMAFDVLCMTWVGIDGLSCFARRFLTVACIITFQ